MITAYKCFLQQVRSFCSLSNIDLNFRGEFRVASRLLGLNPPKILIINSSRDV